MDAQTQRALAEYTRELTRLTSQVEALSRGQRTSQLAHSSLEEGQTIEARDETGALRGRWGWVDGAVGLVTEGGDPVSAPTAPTVTPSLGGLRVTWDGLLSGDPAIPVDFDHMAVHVSTSAGFTPSAATYVGSIRRAGEGGMLPVVPLPYVPHYVVLIPVTTGGVQGEASAEVAATPLQTSGVDLEADSIEAVHIKAGAVEADKLQAVLALVTTIIAGIPGAARVEMDQDGLRGYNSENELIFAIDSSGNAVFSGDIVASEISGSRFLMTSSSGATGAIEGNSGGVTNQVQSGNMGASLAATGSQANFTARSDIFSASSPLAGFAASGSAVSFALDSSATSADGLPSVTGTATPEVSQLTIWSKRNSLADPRASLTATGTDTSGTWTSASGSQVQVSANASTARVLMTPPAATDPGDASGPGYVFAHRTPGDDTASVSLQSPMWQANTGPEYQRRSAIFAEGALPSRTYTRVLLQARRVLVGGESVSGTWDTTTDGVVELADTHSLYAPRHAPLRTDMATAPGGGATGTWIPFSGSAWPPLTFRTGWSGRVRVTITGAAGNNNSATSTVHMGFALTGGSSVPAAVARAWSARGVVMQCCSRVVYLDLVANATYTLTPAWNYNNGTVGSTVNWYTTYEHSMVVEPLA
ncbi:hypothetical protein [Nocardiopsis sp. CA-288880]|uniref:hypothetical protein n=1 Tax=Nocardiopsis sp. CA-288880 TaxID=3239995 RepID=UPI003D98A377